MLNTFITFLSASLIFCCHGLPENMSETYISESKNLHLYTTNSTDDVNHQLTPISTQHHETIEKVEFVRNAINPFFSFLYDTLGDVEYEMGALENEMGDLENEMSDLEDEMGLDCLDDTEMTPDDLSETDLPNCTTEASEPIEPTKTTDVPAPGENKPNKSATKK